MITRGETQKCYIHFNTVYVIPHPIWCFPARLKITVWEKQSASAETFKLTKKNKGDDSLNVCNSCQHQLPKQQENGYVQNHFKEGVGGREPISIHIYVPLFSF